MTRENRQDLPTVPSPPDSQAGGGRPQRPDFSLFFQHNKPPAGLGSDEPGRSGTPRSRARPPSHDVTEAEQLRLTPRS